MIMLNTTARCQVALEISHQPHLLLLLSLTICVSLFGLACTYFLAYYLYRKPIYHVNIRLLLWSMCLALTLVSGGLCYLAVDHLVVFVRYQRDPCKMMVGYSACHAQRTMAFVLPGFVVANSAVALAIERGYAAHAYRSYDTQPSRTIGIGLIAAQWLIGGMPGVAGYMKNKGNLVGSMPYCISLMLTPGTAIVGLPTALFIDVVGLLFVVRLFLKSKKLSRKVDVESATVNGSHLSSRYQLRENVKTTRMLIPCMVTHALMNIVAMSVGMYIATTGRLQSDEDVKRMAACNELTSLLMSCYAPAFCITCIVQSPSLLKHVRNEWACLKTPPEDTALPDATYDHKTAAVHLDNIWMSTKNDPQQAE